MNKILVMPPLREKKGRFSSEYIHWTS